jgi:murein DD-endopeptidase MepM/ murein hydrolase activator NlpD
MKTYLLVKTPIALVFATIPLLFVPAGHAQDYACPMPGSPQIRQGDAVAPSGGRFDSSREGGKKHGALDLNAHVGDPVYAARDGRVAIAEKDWGKMGNTVIIDHGDGDYTVYGHLDTIAVSPGQVSKGAKVGTVGYSGNAVELKNLGLAAHLHFALIKAGKSGLADAGKPLTHMKQWGDYWQSLGADLNGPVNPGLFMDPSCWTGSTRVGAPGET